jgi:hypothetical protein
MIRLLPRTIAGRANALNGAHNALINQAPGTQVLSSATAARLVAMQPLYTARIRAVQHAMAEQTAHTPTKNAAVNEARTLANHFIQVFNLGVARGKYRKAHRANYGLDTDSDRVPDMLKESLVLYWCKAIVTGDAARVAAGGLPMANPDAGEVQAAATAAQAAIITQSTLHLNLNNAQEALEALNKEADRLIRRIWNEVETFYSEESPSSMRDKARAWGLLYAGKGPAAVLSGRVLLPGGAPAAGAVITLVQSGARATANEEGRFTISTLMVGDADLRAALPPYIDTGTALRIPEHHDELSIPVPDIVLNSLTPDVPTP